MKVLALNDLSITYDGEKKVVSHVSLEAEQGQIISIVGESGSGKSTLIHGVLGLLPKTASIAGGTIRLLDQPVDGSGQIQKMRGRDAAIIFQDAGRYMNPIARVGAQYVEFIRSHEKLSRKECLSLAEEMLHRLPAFPVHKIVLIIRKITVIQLPDLTEQLIKRALEVLFCTDPKLHAVTGGDQDTAVDSPDLL